MAKKDKYDVVKEKFEDAYDELIVTTVVDYNDRYVVVGCKRKDGEERIPGDTYKIEKRTGKVEFFSPIMDLDGFGKALKERSKKYE